MNKLLHQHYLTHWNICRYYSSLPLGASVCKPLNLEAVIGLEVHSQISSNTKLFSGAQWDFSASPNSRVAFLDAALPGTLPRINQQCVNAAVLAAAALKCQINPVSKFDRKHYFYADLPAGYQITQQREPIARAGHVTYLVTKTTGKTGDGAPRVEYLEKTARITQIQLEQDSGKSLHDAEDQLSLIDLNRAGCALLEIVTEPDFRSATEAASFVHELRNILMLIGVCNGKMEQGNLRVDASVSLHEPGKPLGIRSEVKNINSMRNIAKAINYEIRRQTNLLSKGKEVESETRNYDAKSNKTIAMRDKEKVHDYRFLPEPNLPPLRLYTNDTIPKDVDPGQIVNIDVIRRELPILPHEQRQMLINVYKLDPKYACDISETLGMFDFFDSIFEANPNCDIYVVNGLMIHLKRILSNLSDDNKFVYSPVTPEDIAEITNLITTDKVTTSSAKMVLNHKVKANCDGISEVIDDLDLWKISDSEQIKQCCIKVIESLEEKLKSNKSTKKKPKVLIQKYKMKLKEDYNGRIDEQEAEDMLKMLLK